MLSGHYVCGCFGDAIELLPEVGIKPPPFHSFSFLCHSLLTNATHTWRMAFTWPFLPLVGPHLCKSCKPNMYIFLEFAGYRPLRPFSALPEILDCPNSSPGTMACNQQVRQWVLILHLALESAREREPIPKPLKWNQHLQIVLPLHKAWGAWVCHKLE
jgi:hypothetical protein